MRRLLGLFAAALTLAVLLLPPSRTQAMDHYKYFDNLVYRTYVDSDPTDTIDYLDVQYRHGGAGYHGHYGSWYRPYRYYSYYPYTWSYSQPAYSYPYSYYSYYPYYSYPYYPGYPSWGNGYGPYYWQY